MEEKYLPLEVSDENLDAYVHELMEMMPEEKLFEGEGVNVIPEAHGYIGKERAVAAEKIAIIDLMTKLVGQFRRNWVDTEAMARDADPKRKEMDNVMDRILAMVNPEEREKARALISRIWKYFEESEKNIGVEGRPKHIPHYTLTANLAAEFAAKEIYPLTAKELSVLLSHLKRLKKDPTKLRSVLSQINSDMVSAAQNAHRHSGRAREIAKFRKEYQSGVSETYLEISKIRDYIVAKAKEMGWR